MNLRSALRVNKPESIAFVGAGGKTTSIFRLAYELPHPVIVTTTTHLGAWQVRHGDRWLVGLSELEKLTDFDAGVTVLTGQPISDDRLGQLSSEELEYLHRMAIERGWSLLIEADGARQLPFKAPAEHEPVIPAWVDKVVVVAGLSGLNSPCNNAYIHRPEIFSTLAQLKPGERVGEEHLSRMLLH
ncbi:putative selenium-dependent hydroxylase accessory protein YqeC, partial [bacterium]